jgi:hypothetical protein
MTSTERRRVVVQLLDQWANFFAIARSGTPDVASGPSDDTPSKTDELSALSRHPSVVELQRCLLELRKVAPAHFVALCAYFEAPTRTVEKDVRLQGPHGSFMARQNVRERVLPGALSRLTPCGCGCSMPRSICDSLVSICTDRSPLAPFGWDVKVACELPIAVFVQAA